MQTVMQAAFRRANKMNDRKLADQLNVDLRIDEGVSRKIYLDTKGIPTIGIGHNCKVEPLPPGFTPPLTDSQIDYLFDIDLQEEIGHLDSRLPMWRGLDFVRQCVILNMSFNLGIDGLLEFHRAISAIKNGDFTEAAKEMKDSDWFHQVGARAVRLCAEMSNGVKS